MGKIYAVGIGPGADSYMTKQAEQVLEHCDVIIGYQVYIDLIRDNYSEKKLISGHMRGELKRCRQAFEEATQGNEVAMICSGDAGVYGMAGLLLEVGTEYPEIEVEVVCGISAVMSGAAIFGAPLMHDFAVVSLSDLMTPWETIEKRVRMAAEADFVLCFYNPSSRKRTDYLQRACDILLQCKSADTVCGVVRNIGREGEAYQIMPLSELREIKVDMFCTVFIGNSQTKRIGNQMVTPRGYQR